MTALPEPMPARSTRLNRAAASPDLPRALTPAAASVLAGVPEWWAARARAAGLSGQWLEVDWAIAGAVMPDWISATSPLDVAGTAAEKLGMLPLNLAGTTAEELGMLYVSQLDPRERAQHGRHYTSKVLAENLWAMTKRALGWKRPQALSGLVRDPACGAGALLLPILREHLGAAARVDAQLALAGLPNVIAGTDTDENAVWLANVLLASEMLPILARTPRARRRPLPALAAVGDGLAPAGVPTLATVMNPPYGRVRLGPAERERFAESLYGHANLYGLFMATGLDAIAGDGVLSALVPTSFLAGRYFENLRRVLAEQAPLREIAFVADRSGSFGGVLQETCLATFSSKRVRRVTISTIGPQTSEVATVRSPRGVLPWLLPRHSDDAPTAAAAIGMRTNLRSVGWRVSTGPLVWNRRKADLGPRAGAGRVPVLWAADIDGGKVHRDAARDSTRYLTLRGNDEHVMVLTEPAVLVQRTTAPEQTRRLVTAHLTADVLAEWGGRVVVENHVNVIRAARGQSQAVSAELLARLLATVTTDRVLRCLSGSVAVSAYELEALPLPDLDVMAGWSDLGDAEFDAAVARAYRPVTS